MKIAQTLRRTGRNLRRRKGIALVTVLTVMALTTILILTFFSLATSEHRASTTYSQGLQAQQVAEQAVNMVIAQIREATTVGNEKAWASQPGSIRVWDNSGDVDTVYKLYSDDRMKTTDSGDFSRDFAEMQEWSSEPAHFVDLNEPVIRGERVYYPIVHPAAATEPEWPRPLGDDSNGVEGFSYNKYDGRKLNDQGSDLHRDAAIAADAAGGHLPMPVRWIYQLADGTLGVLAESSSGGGGGTGEAFEFRAISGGGTPSRKNPMVARFAYWADDETSKLNINTHVGGLAWDVPKAGGELDMNMGKFQPAQKEWQRYPGHPATTHLIPALAPGVLDIVNDRDAMEMLYEVVPRVVGGGSESGTRIIDTHDPEEANGLVPDKEPLFPSVDDMIMDSDREPHEFPDAQGDPVPPDELSEYLERAKFFITATSRAPETNLYNQPRVAIWPIREAEYETSEYRDLLTSFDELIHFTASMGESPGGDYPRHEYIFKREQADSATHDYENIPRNRELYEYLAEALENRYPGYGGRFSDKYSGGAHRQILTQIFDYIRTTNLHDDSIYEENFERAFTLENTDSHLTYTNPRRERSKSLGHKGHGQVVPIRIDDTKGFGRFYSLGSAQIMAIAAGQFGKFEEGRYPGLTEYQPGNWDSIADNPEGEIFFNLPPLPPAVDESVKATWPQWLRSIDAGTAPSVAGEVEAAFDPENWNWQLAFLDPTYLGNVLADPDQRFQRSALGPASMGTETRLEEDETLVQGAFLFNLFTPSVGWNAINPDMTIEITANSGMTFESDDRGDVPFLGFAGRGEASSGSTYTWATNWVDSAWGGRRYGGLMPFEFTLAARADALVNAGRNLTNTGTFGGRTRLTPLDRGYKNLDSGLASVDREIGGSPGDVANSYRYDLVTPPFKISGDDLSFSGGDVEFVFRAGGEYVEASAPDTDSPSDEVQTIELNFDRFNVPAPYISPPDMGNRNFRRTAGWINEFGDLARDSFGYLERNSLTADPGNPDVVTNDHKSGEREGSNKSRAHGRMGQINVHRRPGMFSRGDVVQSVEIVHGDGRLVAGKAEIDPDDGLFEEHRDYGADRMGHSMTNSVGHAYTGAAIEDEYLIIPTLPGNNPYRNRAPIPFGVEPSSEVQNYGDFDNGTGLMIDGPYINKPDEGNTHSLQTKFMQQLRGYWEERRNYGEFPYFNREWRQESGGPAYFSPNRLVSGPGMFGSLPTGVVDGEEWRTLLFRPNVVGNGYDDHPGADNPPDHLIMDLFWMPIVEPYAISEPLSTAGKVNLNYEMVPFLHVERNTALRGVFRSEFVLIVPNEWHNDYKHNQGRGSGYHWRDNPYGGTLQGKRLRAAIVDDATLAQFRERFDQGNEMFKSASEITEMHLVREEVSTRLGFGSKGSVGSYTPTVEQMETGEYWRDHALVGDNSRERPYTNIHNRLTTKSNTFKVHYRAQVLKQARRDSDAEYSEWRPLTDTVQAEYRGASIVERYVDPNDTEIPDFATNTSETLDEFYQYRVVNPRRFAP